jgi:hypothetical protein
MEQMMEHLPAEIRTNQAKATVSLKEMKEEIRNNQAKVDANLKEMKEEMRAGQKLLKGVMLAKIEIYQERVKLTTKSGMPRFTPIKER